MDIHIATPDGTQRVCPETEARQQWTAGALPEGTLYWQEGMTDWKQIGELCAANIPAAAFVPPPMPPVLPRLTFTKDPETLTTIVKILLWISLGASLLSLASNLAQLTLAHSSSISTEMARDNDERQQMIAGLGILLFVVTGVPFLMWIHRANVNVRGFGAKNLEFTPGWAVGYYFIPIISLIKPYQAMKEIWKASVNPSGWFKEPDSALVGWWWGFWIGWLFLNQISAQFAKNVHAASSLATATMFGIAVSIVHSGLILVAIALVSAIYKKQKALVDSGV